MVPFSWHRDRTVLEIHVNNIVNLKILILEMHLADPPFFDINGSLQSAEAALLTGVRLRRHTYHQQLPPNDAFRYVQTVQCSLSITVSWRQSTEDASSPPQRYCTCLIGRSRLSEIDSDGMRLENVRILRDKALHPFKVRVITIGVE